MLTKIWDYPAEVDWHWHTYSLFWHLYILQ
jgi:hypothetical protein